MWIRRPCFPSAKIIITETISGARFAVFNCSSKSLLTIFLSQKRHSTPDTTEKEGKLLNFRAPNGDSLTQREILRKQWELAASSVLAGCSYCTKFSSFGLCVLYFSPLPSNCSFERDRQRKGRGRKRENMGLNPLQRIVLKVEEKLTPTNVIKYLVGFYPVQDKIDKVPSLPTEENRIQQCRGLYDYLINTLQQCLRRHIETHFRAH